MKNVWNIDPEEVYASIQEDEYLREIVTLDDCVLAEGDRSNLSLSSHPASDYIGYPIVQREILAEQHALRRLQQNECRAQQMGHLALVG